MERNKAKKKQPLFYIATTIRPYLDGRHKSIARHLIKSFNTNYLENKEGEKILFATCKKKDIDGKVDIPCSCGCSKPLGTMETLTEKQMKDKFPQVYYQNPFCWKCESKKVIGKKTFWDKDKDELITFFNCETCGKVSDKVLNNGMLNKGKEMGFSFEQVHCNKCSKGLWTDWNSKERVDMYKNNELFYHCSKCLGMSTKVGQGGWIALNLAKYEAIKQKEYHELNTIADNIKYYANNNQY